MSNTTLTKIELEARYQMREHDYDPNWDYEVREDLFTDCRAVWAQRVMDLLAARADTPFEVGHVFPADLNATNGAIAVYCSGTYNEPVVVIDLAAHSEPFAAENELYGPGEMNAAIEHTITHEIYHAIQESEGLPFTEDEAEDWNPFTRERF